MGTFAWSKLYRLTTAPLSSVNQCRISSGMHSSAALPQDVNSKLLKAESARPGWPHRLLTHLHWPAGGADVSEGRQEADAAHSWNLRRQLGINRFKGSASLTIRGPLMASCHRLRQVAGSACHNQPCLPWHGFVHNRYEAFAIAPRSAGRKHLQPETAGFSRQGMRVLQYA